MPLPNNWYTMDGEFADVATAETLIFGVPVAGYLRKVQTVLNGAITVADDTITVARNGTDLSPTITIAFTGSAAGTVDSANYFQPVAEGDRVTVATAGTSTGPNKAAVTLTFSG